MRTAAICPTCATYENAVCVIYNGLALTNINVPPLTNLEVALVNIDSTVEDLQSQIDYLSTNPINLTTNGTNGPATFESNVLNIPEYQPTLQEVTEYGNTTSQSINVADNAGDSSVSVNVNNIELNDLVNNVITHIEGNQISIFDQGASSTSVISFPNPTDEATFIFPSTGGTLAIIDDITLQNATSGTNKNLTNNLNFQGTGAGNGYESSSSTNINAFGENASAVGGTEVIIQNINAFGKNAANGNSGYNVNAFGNAAGQDNTFNNVNLFGSSATATADDQVVFSKNGGAQLARIGYGGISANRLYTLPDATGTLALTNTVWSLSGNASTNPSTNFIGTTDDQDVVFKRNSIEYLRFKTTGANDDVYFSKNIKLQGTTPQIWLNGSSGYSVISTDSTGGFIQLNNNNSHSATIKAANLTTDKTLQLPNEDGTLALEYYKVYTAVISQTGTGAPTVDYVLKNTLGFTPTFNYSGAGSYTIQAPALNWSANKVIVFVNPGYQAIAHTIGWERSSTTLLSLYTVNSTNNTFTNSLLNKASIEIRIYP